MKFVKKYLGLARYYVARAVKANAVSLGQVQLSMYERHSVFIFNLLEISRAGRRRFELLGLKLSTGPMWWAVFTVFGITVSTALEHDEDEEGTIVGPDFRKYVLSFNFFQPIK